MKKFAMGWKGPEQNRVAERRNRTVIKAVRTMVLVVKPHFKTLYEPFKDEGIFVGYSTTSKAFKVYNIRTRKVKENMYITYLENKPMIAGTNSNDFAGKGASFDAASESDNQERPNAESSTKTANTAGPIHTATSIYADYPDDPLMPDLEDARIFDDAYDDRDEGVEADYNNLEAVISVSNLALDDESWVEAMQEKLLQFKLLNVWTLVDLPPEKRAIGTKWVYRNKRDQRGIVVRNKARLVAQGHKQEEDIDFDEVFSLVTRIKAIRRFMLANLQALWIQSSQIECTRWKKLYMVFIKLLEPDDIIFGSTKRSLSNEFEKLMHKRFQMSSTRELTFFLGLQVDQRKDGIFLSKDKYVSDILMKFGFSSVKSASTPMETRRPLSNDAAGTDVDVHLYRSMIGSLMYLTSSRPDIMFVVLKLKGYLINDGYADLVQHDDKKELAISGQTATGKELSNPLMASSLPKTTLPTLLVLNVVSVVQLLLNAASWLRCGGITLYNILIQI
nr:hypothetical protein [Tanacetum cinerariifolium]